MNTPVRTDLEVSEQKAVLVGVPDSRRNIAKEHVLDELKGLAKTAGVHVVGELVQLRGKPVPATCLGKGKLQELKELVEATDADLVIFDNNLTPSQGRNIEQELKRIIVDRSELILDIFASHARTFEAKLQVELAQLRYTRTRLKRMWTHLERIEGGIGASRGPGEKQIETDRRLIDQRIDELQARLVEIEQRRERMVRQREAYSLVSLVGYTNAGKSTLMKALTGADVYIADQLFATLDPRTRKWSIPAWGDVLLSDTVGFVRDLPHSLVASFRSTLEEARQADLLLHVVDASNPEAEEQIDVVEKVLHEIEIDTSRCLLVLNKADIAEDRGLIDTLRAKFSNAITVSAVSGYGIDVLTKAVAERLSDGYVVVDIETSPGNGKLFAFLAEHAEVLERRFEGTSAYLQARVPRPLLWRIQGEGVSVQIQGSHATSEPGLPSTSTDDPATSSVS